jgi:hypothetical protein
MAARSRPILNGAGGPGPAAVASKGRMVMHAVFVTYRSTSSSDEEEGNREYAEALRDGAAPGFVSKTWISDGITDGGFHVFQDRGDADRYLEGMFTEAVISNPDCFDVRIERYEVNQDLSTITNGVSAMATSRRD